MDLPLWCVFVSEELGNGEGPVSEELSSLSDTQ